MPDSQSSFAALSGARCRVLLPLPLAGAYDYEADPALALAPGEFVAVPLGGRETIGVVWDATDGDDGVDPARLKPVIARLETPALPAVSRRFVEWVSDYCMAPLGAVLRMTMSVSAALQPPRPVAAWRPTAAACSTCWPAGRPGLRESWRARPGSGRASCRGWRPRA